MPESPFTYINAINSNTDIIRNSENPELAEKEYNAFMVNRGLSYYMDTVLYANEMNMLAGLDSLLQFDYLINSVRPRKRFAKWAKRGEDVNLEVIKEYFGYGYKKAQQVLAILSTQQIEEIKTKLEKGGKK